MEKRNCPNPCDKCDYEGCRRRGTHYKACPRWNHWFLWWWKRFQDIYNRRKSVVEKFRYLHPDEVRRYLQRSPCSGCSDQKKCDVPCEAYLKWYNARIELARKRAGL